MVEDMKFTAEPGLQTSWVGIWPPMFEGPTGDIVVFLVKLYSDGEYDIDGWSTCTEMVIVVVPEPPKFRAVIV